MEATVWVDDWQRQGCGDPFSVGSRVEWTTAEPDRRWLGTVLGDAGAAVVTHEKDHHGDGSLQVEGRVRTITAVYLRFVLVQRDKKLLLPVAGTTALRPVPEADGCEAELEGLTFRGYLVELT